MLKFPDGEWRTPFKNNDYSDETAESKMKFYWLFEWESSVVFSFVA